VIQSDRGRDQQGGFPRVRPFHCTEVGLTPAIIPNADNSGAQFLFSFGTLLANFLVTRILGYNKFME
jgi:hypothetical protein